MNPRFQTTIKRNENLGIYSYGSSVTGPLIVIEKFFNLRSVDQTRSKDPKKSRLTRTTGKNLSWRKETGLRKDRQGRTDIQQ